MGKSKKPPPPPDTSKYSDEAFGLGQQMKDWAQQMWTSGQEEWNQIRDWSQQYMGYALPAMEEQFSWAREMQDRFDTYVMPQMQSLFTEAEVYASKAEEQRQRAQAIQDTKSAMEAQRQSQLRQLESYGIDPSDLRYAALDKQAGLGEAAASALAANQAGERTKQIGRDLRSEAINTAGLFLGERGQGYAGGTQTGATGLGTSTQAIDAGARMPTYALPYMTGAQTGTESAAGIVDTSYGRQLNFTDATNKAKQQDFNNYMALGESIASIPMGGFGMGGKLPTSGHALAEGGPVSAPGGPTDDAGAMAISDGEYVIPADVVRKLGTNHFDKMIEKETGRPPPTPKQAVPIPQKQQTSGVLQ